MPIGLKKKTDKYKGADFVKPADYQPKLRDFRNEGRQKKQEPQELRFKQKIRNIKNLA